MKKILGILGAISLIGTSTTSLVACNISQYSEDELKKEKEKHNLNINGNILEWMAPQENPFNEIDNKYYFVVWHNEKTTDWRIIKFQNNSSATIKIDNFDNCQLEKTDLGMGKDLYITNQSGFIKYVSVWKYDNGTYFKSVYRWNKDIDVPNLVVDKKTGEIKGEGE